MKQSTTTRATSGCFFRAICTRISPVLSLTKRVLTLTGMLLFASVLSAQSITLSSQETMWIDANKCNDQGPRGAWLSFKITNNTASTLNNVVVTFAGFTGANPTYFEVPSDLTRTFTTLAPAEVVPVYYYIDYSELCNHPNGGGCDFDGYTADYTITVSSTGNPSVVRNGTISTDCLLTAAAAGIAQSSVLGPGISVGQVFTQTVVYSFGNNTDLFIQPAGEADFQDECLRLIGSEITAVSAGVSPTLIGQKDQLHFPTASIPGGGGTITVVYKWVALCTNISQIANPWAAAKSGTKYKYQGFGSSTTVPPAVQAISISKSVNPSFLPTATSDGGFGNGIAEWTVTLTNSSSVVVVVDKINDVIPACMTLSTPLAPSSGVTAGNSASSPAVGSTGLVSWVGKKPGNSANHEYKVPANGTLTLVYRTNVSACASPRSYTNSATASIGSTTVGPATATISIGILQADLAITKTDGSATYTPGVGVTYTVVVTNNGPSNAAGATVTDNAPAGTSITSWTATFAGGATGGAAGIGNINETVDVPVGGTITYTINVAVPAGLTGNLVNTATIAAPTGTIDPTPGNNSATDIDTPNPAADLSITKTDGIGTYTAGTTTTYTIVVTNGGPSNVTGATVTDNIPAGTSWTYTATGTPGTSGFAANGNTSINHVVNIPAGGSITYTVILSIPAGFTGNLVNTAMVTLPAGTTDATPGNNSATDIDTPNPAADLSITKTDGIGTYTAGTTTTYTIVVTNGGPSDVTGATVTDNIPAGTSWTYTATGTPGTSGFAASGNTSINHVVNIPAGGSITYTVILSIPAGFTGNLVNTATVTLPAGTTDVTPGNNTATDIDTPNPAADLSITKTDGIGTYTTGTTTTYTIVVTNGGPSNVTGATVTDNIPAGTSWTYTATGTPGTSGFAASGNTSINHVVTIPVGGSITYTVILSIPAGFTGNLVNTATVTLPAGTTDATPGNNTATDIDTPSPVADLVITKTDGSATYTPGIGVTYTVVVSNAGPSNAVGATVTDNAPAGTSITSWTAVFAGGATGNASGFGNISQTVNVPAGGSITYTINLAVPAGLTGNLVNIANVAPPNGTTDPTPGNNSAMDADTPNPIADLTITKTDGSATYTPGVGVTYTVVVTNTGPSDAFGATVTDNAPAGTSITSWTAVFAGGATGNASGFGNVSQTVNVPVGGTITYTIIVAVPAGLTGNLVNTATVAVPAGTIDPTPGNNTATDSDTPNPAADLSITKTDGIGTYTAGTTTTYTIVVTNGGPSNVIGATVTDNIPAGTSWTYTATGTPGTSGFPANGNASINHVVNIPAGGSITYTVILSIPAGFTGNLVNTATVTLPAGTTDATPGNNSATDTDTPNPAADLSITKTDGIGTYTAGTTTTYTIVVTNGGPSNVIGATVTDNIPAGTSWTYTATGTPGTSGFAASGNTSINHVVNIPAGGSITYTVILSIPAGFTGNLVNTATVTLPAGTTDATPGNNTATDIDTPNPAADLSITKTDGIGTYTAGTTTTYTIVVTNGGPSNVTGATVTDNIPAGTSWTYTATGTPGTSGFAASGNTSINHVVNIPAGGSITYTVILSIPAGFTGNLVNTATVTLPAGTTDATPGNNTATDIDTPNPVADLVITKTDGSATYTPGIGVTYTVVVSNAGPSNAFGATVTDNAPAGTSITSWTAVFAGGATGNAAGIGNISQTVNVPVGGTITYTINLAVPAGLTGNLVNTATVAAPNGTTDPTPGNNSATDTDTPNPIADLAITKTDGSFTYTPGVGVTYTVVVTNTGPSDAFGATVTDNAPAGTSITSWTAVFAGGATGNAAGIGNISQTVNVPVGGTITYTVNVAVPANQTGNLVNTATIAITTPGGTIDPNAGNNSATDTDTPNPIADLSITKTDGSATYTPGVGVTYTVMVTNTGPSDAFGATVTDNAPAGTSITSWTAVFAGGATGNAAGIGNISQTVNVPAGGTITYTINLAVPAGLTGNLVNTATVAAPNGTTDPTPGNNSATDTDTAFPQANLSLVKTVNNASPVVGTNVVFTLTVTNAGPSVATGVTVKDLLPAGLVYVSDNSANEYNSVTGIWTVGSLANGASRSIQITVTVTTAGNKTNYAQVNTSNAFDPNSTPGDNSTNQDDDDQVVLMPICVTPSFTVCPGPQTIYSCGATAVNYAVTAYGVPTPGLTYVFTGATMGNGNGTGSGSIFNIGTTNVVITAANVCGSATCSFTITVSQPPLASFINAPGNINVACGTSVQPSMLSFSNGLTGPGQISGNVTSIITGGSNGCGGTYTETWTYTDLCMRTISYSRTITANPSAAPVFASLPGNITISCATGTPASTPLNFSNGQTGPCEISGMSNSTFTLLNDACPRRYTETWTFTDPCNRTISHSRIVTVNVLWQNANIGAANGNATYACSQTVPGDFGPFQVTSAGYGTSTSDIAHFIYAQLSGDGTIIAKFNNATNQGFGGIMFRESLAPGAKKASLRTQNSLNNVQREVRQTTNGYEITQQWQRLHKWLRLDKIGNIIAAYTSPDGINWWSCPSWTTVVLGDCFYVGVFAEGVNVNSPSTATFDVVRITGFNQLPVPLATNNDPSDLVQDQNVEQELVEIKIPTDGQTRDNTIDLSDLEVQSSREELDMFVFPNPASTGDDLNLELSGVTEGRIRITVYSMQGTLVKELWMDAAEDTRMTFRLPGVIPGFYLIKAETANRHFVTRRVSIIRR